MDNTKQKIIRPPKSGSKSDLTNKRFGYLLVLKYHSSYLHYDRGYRRSWECLCDCGKVVIKKGSDLIRKHTKSCGCYRKEQFRKVKFCGYLDPGESCKRHVLATYKQHAKNRGLEFLLSLEQFVELSQQVCYYCKQPPNNRRTLKNIKGEFVYNGIDRKNNDLGYILDNCVSCCKICNKMKNTLTETQFIEHIKRIVRNFND